MTDIILKEGQPWKITFSAHDSDGSVLPLTSGAEVEMRVNRTIAGVTSNIIEVTMASGVVITDPEQGHASITISEEQKNAVDPPLSSDDLCFYEIRIIIGGVPETQAEGQLIIEDSLFATPVNVYLGQFRARFPEFSETSDPAVAMYIEEANLFVSKNEALAASTSRILAILYLAAHLLQLGKRAATLSSSGGVSTTGQIKSIKIEDRTVQFSDSASKKTESSTSAQGLGSTVYGARYLALLRQFPQFVQRA